MLDQPIAFRIETGGPLLPSRGRYAAGEADYPGTADGRARERTHAFTCLAVVVSGSFDFKTPIGAANATAGSMIFGHAGEAFTYRYFDARGAKRSVIAFSDAWLDEVAASCGYDAATFAVAAISPRRSTTALYGLARRIALSAHDVEDEVFELAAAALALGREVRRRQPTARERRRVRDIARLIDVEYPRAWRLDELSATAQLSKFHFLRAFKDEMGDSPGRYLVAARLRAAIELLIATREPISSIALRVGFNDLSHFNSTFRATFGASPSAWRIGTRN